MSGNELQPVASGKYQLTYTSNQQEFVTMQIGEQLFGISVMVVQDVLRRQTIAPVPLAPHIVAGSLNLRGRIVTAIDMRKRLGMSPFEDTKAAMQVVVSYHDELYSLVVDKVGEVLSLPLDNFEKAPPNLSDSWKDVSSGVFKLDNELLIIMDVHHIIGT